MKTYAKSRFSHDAAQMVVDKDLWLCMDSIDSIFLHLWYMIGSVDSTGRNNGITHMKQKQVKTLIFMKLKNKTENGL